MAGKKPKTPRVTKNNRRVQIYAALIIAAGGIIAVIIARIWISPPSSALEITSLTPISPSMLDVQVRNIGSVEALITELTVLILEDRGIPESTELDILPYRPPSGRYNLSIGELQVDQSTSVHVSHSVGENKADRFLVGLARNTRRLKVKLTITYNRNQIVSETVWMVVLSVTKNIR